MSQDAQKLDQLLKDLKAQNPVVRRHAALKLGMMHNPAVVADLIRAADDPDDTVRALIASALASIGTPALDRLRAALQSESAHVRQTVVTALHHMKNSQVVADLIPLLQDTSPAVRQAVMNALNAYNTPEARDALSRGTDGL